MFWVILVLIAVISYFAVLKVPGRWRVLQKVKSFPGPPALPLVGNALELNVPRVEVLKVLQGWISTYGSRYLMFVGPQPYIVIANAPDMERILSSSTEIRKSHDYELTYSWLGLGLLTSGGEKWFKRRKHLTPAFHFKILEDFLKVFNEQCTTFHQVLQDRGTSSFDIFPLVTHCALDIICESAMGRKIGAQQKSDSDYVKALYRMSELIQYRQLRPWLLPDLTWNLSSEGKEEARCLKILHEFTEQVIKERKKERETNKGQDETKPKPSEEDSFTSRKRLAFLDLLFETQEADSGLTDLNIREETDTFMFEGHDTTSAAVSWTAFLLACHPEIQKKVQQELDSIFADDPSRDATSADLTQMKYLESCIKEGLRLYPSVPFVGRTLIKDLEMSDGVIAPASATLFIFFHQLHRDEKYFPDPERFDPDRFLPENMQGRHAFAYLPFSAGPRNCIGQKFALMEEKVMLSTIFRNFNVKSVKKQEEVGVLCELITRPEGGIHVTLEKR